MEMHKNKDYNNKNCIETKELVINSIDTTAPTCNILATGDIGTNNWYISNVQLSVTASDKQLNSNGVEVDGSGNVEIQLEKTEVPVEEEERERLEREKEEEENRKLEEEIQRLLSGDSPSFH